MMEKRASIERYDAETSFAGLIEYLEKDLSPSFSHSTPRKRRASIDFIGIAKYESMPAKKNPHKKPHPRYVEGKSILGKTKFGIPVTEDQFRDNTFLYAGQDVEDFRDNRWWDAYHRSENARLLRQEAKSKTFSGLFMNDYERQELADWRTRQRHRIISIGSPDRDEMSEYAQFISDNVSDVKDVAVSAVEKERRKDRKVYQTAKLGRRDILGGLTKHKAKNLLQKSPFWTKQMRLGSRELSEKERSALEAKYNSYVDEGWDGRDLDEYPGVILSEGCGKSILNDYDPRFVDGGWDGDDLIDEL